MRPYQSTLPQPPTCQEQGRPSRQSSPAAAAHAPMVPTGHRLAWCCLTAGFTCLYHQQTTNRPALMLPPSCTSQKSPATHGPFATSTTTLPSVTATACRKASSRAMPQASVSGSGVGCPGGGLQQQAQAPLWPQVVQAWQCSRKQEAVMIACSPEVRSVAVTCAPCAEHPPAHLAIPCAARSATWAPTCCSLRPPVVLPLAVRSAGVPPPLCSTRKARHVAPGQGPQGCAAQSARVAKAPQACKAHAHKHCRIAGIAGVIKAHREVKARSSANEARNQS